MILLTTEKQSMAVGKVLQMDSNQASKDPESLLHVHIIMSFVKTVPALDGKSLRWPKKLIAKPVRIAANPENHTSLNSSPQEASKPLPSPVTDLPANGQDDRVFNHGLQVLQMGVFLMQLDDTESAVVYCIYPFEQP